MSDQPLKIPFEEEELFDLTQLGLKPVNPYLFILSNMIVEKYDDSYRLTIDFANNGNNKSFFFNEFKHLLQTLEASEDCQK